jgi:hypothetical protein
MNKFNSIIIAAILILGSITIASALINSATPVLKLYAQNDTVNMENPVNCVFSAINPATNIDILHCQAIISVPNSMHVTSRSAAERDSGQCVINFDLKPGELSKSDITFMTDNIGEYTISGVAYYYYGNNVNDTGTTNFTTTVHALQRGAPTNGATPGLTGIEAIIGLISCILWIRSTRRN